MHQHQHQRGFTLIEMIVAVGLFTVVMLISITALLSLVDANRKAQALQSVMNNLNIALDGMVRSIRMGSTYHCGEAGSYSTPVDCPLGEQFLSIQPFRAEEGPAPSLLYWYAEDQNGIGRLYRSEDGSIAGGVPVTSPEVSIESVEFYVVGASRADNVQPKVLVVIRGSAGALKATVRTTFHIQATAVQRILDL